jgi:hypothetical protein
MPTVSVTLEGRQQIPFTYTGPASYSTGGDAVAAKDFKLSRLDFLVFSAAGEEGYVFAYDPSAGKIKALWVDTTTDGAPMAEVAATTNLSGSIVHGVAIGLP